MKKRYRVIISVCLAVYLSGIITALVNIKPLMNLANEAFWKCIAYQLDKEEQERQERMARGEIVRGKDTILIWGNMYEIWHNGDEKYFDIQINQLLDIVLEKVKSYNVVKKKLYVISDEGYAVVDKENLCRVYITVPKEEFVNGYYTDAQGNKIYYSRFLDDPHIQYLSSFDEFSEKEREIFGNLK